jgi:hypothetical protein
LDSQISYLNQILKGRWPLAPVRLLLIRRALALSIVFKAGFAMFRLANPCGAKKIRRMPKNKTFTT